MVARLLSPVKYLAICQIVIGGLMAHNVTVPQTVFIGFAFCRWRGQPYLHNAFPKFLRKNLYVL